MQIQLRPELEQYIEEQVRAGRFASRAELIEAGVARLMLDPPLDPRELAAIQESLEQMKRGQVLDWKQYSASLRSKYFAE